MRDLALEEDLKAIVASDCIDWAAFEGRSLFVTGATGYLGSLVVRSLLAANRIRQLNIRILGLVRNPAKAKALFAEAGTAFVPIVGDIRSRLVVEDRVDYILHAAAVTTSKQMVEEPYETILTTLNGTENVLALACEKQVRGMVFLSSMEVYGSPRADDIEMTEEKLGFVNPLLPRSSYPESKRMAEGLCAAAAHEYGVPVKIARLAQTFGAGISKDENRVFAQFARALRAGEDITLRTDGSKAHCYCYSADAVVGLLMLLTKGEKGEAYNISNESTFCSVREMAERLIAAHPEAGTRLKFDIPEDVAALGFPPSSRMKVISGKMQRLGWRPMVGLEEMYDRLMKSMEANEA